jgi:1-deoxy-D-xylulose-5-phosphate reductoisomerase
VVSGARRSVSILGATGSIGASTADILLHHRDRFVVAAVTANRRAQELGALARKLGARLAVVADPAAYAGLKESLSGSGIEAAAGANAVVAAAAQPVDICVAGIVGAAGLRATFAAARSARVLALANKESLVCVGRLLLDAARSAGTAILPTDSEHNAIFQVLHGRDTPPLAEIILTASGGPFRTASLDAMRQVRPADALRHPTWSMGAKITIDSATLINKGLELIEAHHLFDVEPQRLSVLVHPQSIVHGLVRFTDGSVLAHLGPPDMRVPIASCLAWPERITSGAAHLDLVQVAKLSFEAPDFVRFPGLKLAFEVMAAGGGSPNVFNAANEVAVQAFLEGRLGFLGIVALIRETLDTAHRKALTLVPDSLDDVLALDGEARRLAAQLAPQIAATSW